MLNEVQYQTHRLFDGVTANPSITTMGDSTGKPFFSLAIDQVPDLNFVSPGSGGTMTFARHRYGPSGEKMDNITDWALNKFIAKYGRKGITKDAIFNYVYAVLHDPIYRETYALNLRREFARIPFYADFEGWSKLGKKLMSLHVGFNSVKPWPTNRVDASLNRAKGTLPKPVLRSVADKGLVLVDEDTRITEIPAEAWAYRLGNRSAI